MSTIPAALNPRSPEFDADLYLSQIQDIGGMPDFVSSRAEVAAALWNLGLTKKAIRHDDCGTAAWQDTCAKGHTSTIVTFCGLAICPRCAVEASKDRAQSLSVMLNALSKIDSLKMTYVDLHVPCPPHPDDVRRVREAATRTYLSLLPDCPLLGSHLRSYDEKSFSNTILTSYTAGFTNSGDLIIRFLGIDPHHPANGRHESIKAAFPQASRVVVSTCPASMISKFFRYQLAVAIPTSSAGAANMEQAFTRLRRFITIGQLSVPGTAREEESEIIVQETPSVTNNADESALDPECGKPPKDKKCKTCLGPIIERKKILLSDVVSPPKRH